MQHEKQPDLAGVWCIVAHLGDGWGAVAAAGTALPAAAATVVEVAALSGGTMYVQARRGWR